MNPFRCISSHQVYQNPWIHLREDHVIRPGGKEGVFGIVTMKDGVTILAIDDNNDIIATNEFAYAIDRHSFELVSGGIDEGEAPLECAKRELEEESGYIAEEWIDMGYIDPFTTVIKSRNYMFLARNLIKTQEHPDEGEILHVSKIPYAKALNMAINSEITHGASVALILKAQKYIF